MIIPSQPAAAEITKPTEAEQKAYVDNSTPAMGAGADPATLQKEALSRMGLNGSAPDVNLKDHTPGMIPQEQVSVFDMKPGEISQPFTDTGASYIYKMVSQNEKPLSEVKAQIAKTIHDQMMRDKIQELTDNVKPVLNEAYFGPKSSPMLLNPERWVRTRRKSLRRPSPTHLNKFLPKNEPPGEDSPGYRYFRESWELACCRFSLTFMWWASMCVHLLRFPAKLNSMHRSRTRSLLPALIDLLRETGATSVVHLSFILDPQSQSGVLDVRTYVANQCRWNGPCDGSYQHGQSHRRRRRQFIFPGSVAAYGPETPGPVREDVPLQALPLPYADS